MAEQIIEPIRCDHCGSPFHQVYSTRRLEAEGLRAQYRICNHCGLTFVTYQRLIPDEDRHRYEKKSA